MTDPTAPTSPTADVPPVTTPETPAAKVEAAPSPPVEAMGTTVGLPHSVPWVMTREYLVALRACQPGLDRFDDRAEVVDGVWTLPNGWTPDVSRRMALEAPESLRWYARKGLIPLSVVEAAELIAEVHSGAPWYSRALAGASAAVAR